MIVYSTYCAALKKDTRELLPAIERYRSARIATVYQKAIEQGVPCYILSGKFGWLSIDEKIPYYDHLLLEREVPKHVPLVAAQIKLTAPSKIVYFTRPLESDLNLKSYLKCIEDACRQNDIELEVIAMKEW